MEGGRGGHEHLAARRSFEDAEYGALHRKADVDHKAVADGHEDMGCGCCRRAR